jgi:hypothetical protein
MSYDNPWLHNGQIVEPDQVDTYVGFVYNITNLSNNKQYIGKKLFTKSKTKQVKGKKKKLRVASDWQDYYGSNKELQEDVANLGIHNFKREILRLCKTKGECSYYEAKYQFENDVLLNEAWYNSWISCKIQKSHIKHLMPT